MQAYPAPPASSNVKSVSESEVKNLGGLLLNSIPQLKLLASHPPPYQTFHSRCANKSLAERVSSTSAMNTRRSSIRNADSCWGIAIPGTINNQRRLDGAAGYLPRLSIDNKRRA